MDAYPNVERVVGLLKALADPTRLRILGLVAEGPVSGKELAERLGVGAPTISHHVSKLSAAGVIATERDGQSRRYSLDEKALAAFHQLAAGPGAATAAIPAATEEGIERAKVIKDFFDGERLKQIPAQRKKRVIVLQHLLGRFDSDRDYPEREVNDLLRPAHDDVATLRRELVDYGYMTRSGGVYRVAHALPGRSAHVNQEITGDEHAWLRALIARAAN